MGYFQKKKQEEVKSTASTSLRSTPTVDTIPARVTSGKENSLTVKKKAMAGKYSQHMATRNDTNRKKGWDKSRLEEMLAYYRTNEFVCNGTLCPLQICIVQSVRCAEREKKVATCNTLEPDQAGQLKYRAVTAELNDCVAVVDEITIARVNTGETITLNAQSRPISAQEFFDYVTGKKSGDVLTGIFKTNCEQKDTAQKLMLNKEPGSFIIK